MNSPTIVSCRTSLLGVAEKSHATQGPMVGILGGLEEQREDVGEVGAARFLVDGALVQRGSAAPLRVNGEHVHDGQRSVQHLRRRLDEARVTTVPARAVQVQAVDVHACNMMPTYSLSASGQKE